MAKYEARHLDGECYIVYKSRLFGMLPTACRIAVWDGYGYNYGTNSRPDWYWQAVDGTKSSVRVSFRARWALVRAYRQKNCMDPVDWSIGPPVALLLERASR